MKKKKEENVKEKIIRNEKYRKEYEKKEKE